MHLFRTIPWQYDDHDYEIRVLYDDRVINVVAFINNHPANGYRCQVQIPKAVDAKSLLERHPVPELVEACKNSIMQKRWEALSQVMQGARA
ncbi:hypothetical protein KJ564_06415 [bacterium]|nr:hypothetical protein [bacterium]